MATKGKRYTPEEDFERLSERIWLNKTGKIFDQASFDKEYDKYLRDRPDSLKNRILRKKVFEELRSQHPSISIGRKAKTSNKRQAERGFIFTGFIKGQEVHAKETIIKIRNKEVKRLRDEKGRFAKTTR